MNETWMRGWLQQTWPPPFCWLTHTTACRTFLIYRFFPSLLFSSTRKLETMPLAPNFPPRDFPRQYGKRLRSALSTRTVEDSDERVWSLFLGLGHRHPSWAKHTEPRVCVLSCGGDRMIRQRASFCRKENAESNARTNHTAQPAKPASQPVKRHKTLMEMDEAN